MPAANGRSGRPARSAKQAETRDLQLAVRTLRTPVGVLQVAASADHLVYVEFGHGRNNEARALDRWLRSHVISRRETPPLRTGLAELREYFAGKRRGFDVPIDPAGTPFQQQVWQLVSQIPYGETTTYQAIADALNDPSAARAVGAAVGANPIPIIIPCHRVIGTDGSLTGYGGGLPVKIWLLCHEGVLLA